VGPRFLLNGISPQAGDMLSLPEGAARHVQVLRMQPGHALRVFDGLGREWHAQVAEMGRRHVTVTVGQAASVCGELPVSVTLAVGMPANDRMDTLVEKATELGVTAIQPLLCERAVLRLEGERAARKVAHWQAVAASACEQSGRASVPVVAPVQSLQRWLGDMNKADEAQPGVRRAVLSTAQGRSLHAWLETWGDASAVNAAALPRPACVFLSGPEGGLSESEEQLAVQTGWQPISLGPRILRADTAPLAALSVIGANFER